MKLVTPRQMNEIDSTTINDIGIPGVVLMENAALKVVEEAEKILRILKDKKVVIFAGKGNNGGDALAVARHLYNREAKVRVFILAEKESIKGDAAVNLNALINIGVEHAFVLDGSLYKSIENEIKDSDLVLDRIFGTGLRGEISGVCKDIINIINNSYKKVVAIDIPSGISGETGKLCGGAIRALKTVTFGLPKIGQVIHPGCEYVGELITADIGFPKSVIESIQIKTELIDRNMVSEMIPVRAQNSNKGDYGKILVLSGSPGMTGAGCLASMAALRSGAGLLYLAVPETLAARYDTLLIEPVKMAVNDNGTGRFTKDSLPEILKNMERVSVAAIGPGLSLNDDIIYLVGSILEQSKIPLILDADALNAVSRDVSVLKKISVPVVLTPHPGEMARLAGISIEDVQNNRIEVALSFASKWNVTLVLKGSRTIVAMSDGSIYINTVGNPGMATAGSGDVLTGIIASLAGQGLKPHQAAITGVYLHGMAGDMTAEEKGEHGMLAGDIVDKLPFAMKELLKA